MLELTPKQRAIIELVSMNPIDRYARRHVQTVDGDPDRYERVYLPLVLNYYRMRAHERDEVQAHR